MQSTGVERQRYVLWHGDSRCMGNCSCRGEKKRGVMILILENGQLVHLLRSCLFDDYMLFTYLTCSWYFLFRSSKFEGVGGFVCFLSFLFFSFLFFSFLFFFLFLFFFFFVGRWFDLEVG